MYHFILRVILVHSNINRHEFVSMTPVASHGEIILWSLRTRKKEAEEEEEECGVTVMILLTW